MVEEFPLGDLRKGAEGGGVVEGIKEFPLQAPREVRNEMRTSALLTQDLLLGEATFVTSDSRALTPRTRLVAMINYHVCSAW